MRPWEPISDEKLQAIIADTEQDCPTGEYCPAEIYQMGREIEQLREVSNPGAGERMNDEKLRELLLKAYTEGRLLTLKEVVQEPGLVFPEPSRSTVGAVVPVDFLPQLRAALSLPHDAGAEACLKAVREMSDPDPLSRSKQYVHALKEILKLRALLDRAAVVLRASGPWIDETYAIETKAILAELLEPPATAEPALICCKCGQPIEDPDGLQAKAQRIFKSNVAHVKCPPATAEKGERK